MYSHGQREDYKFHGVTVANKPVKYLGMFPSSGELPDDLNVSKATEKIKNVAQTWEQRTLSLPARVLPMVPLGLCLPGLKF